MSADVLLAEAAEAPVVGSFVVDGLTFAVTGEGSVDLVGVAPATTGEGSVELVGVAPATTGEGSENGSPFVILSEGSEAAEAEGSNESHASEAGATNATLPGTVLYEGAEYALSSIGAYAFYLSGMTDVTLPASVSNVDDRAFRSSDVARVAVDADNPAYSSYDGALYSADMTSLLLIPEGRTGAVRVPSHAASVAPSVFSHCAGVDAIAVDAGCSHLSSENGLLYDAEGATLLRVPAGATEVTIREGCTAIAAGALEGCAKLERINAPASVAAISPDVFTSVPTVSLPAASLAEDAPQLTAMVALSSTDSDLPEVDPADIEISFPEGADIATWKHVFSRFNSVGDALDQAAEATLSSASSYAAIPFGMYCTTGGYIKTCSYQSNANVNTTRATASTGGSRLDCKISGTSCSMIGNNSSGTGFTVVVAPYVGYAFAGWNYDGSETVAFTSRTWSVTSSAGAYAYAVFRGRPYTVTLQDGDASSQISVVYGSDMPEIETPKKPGYSFAGYFSQPDGQGMQYYLGEDDGAASAHTWDVVGNATIYAYWTVGDHDLTFDTSSEPGDEDYPGEAKDDQTIAADQIEEGDKVEIEDPKRPGYVFQGWTIPDAEGMEAVDQDLVYQGEDGKWYVDASKLPDNATDGRVELTARWTSVISVDVPSSVTFYADVVTQENESREGLASSAFGQNKVASQSEVDLRIVGLESKQVKGNGSTSLGASDILKKKDGSAVSGTDDKLFSLYPATGELKEDDLKDPDATSASKPEGAVDFSLDDILLEKSFAADEFTIPAGDTLSLGYRLNLQETSTELDYDKLSTLSEGASASIANISYCFAADYGPVFWTTDDDGSTLELASIKADAEKIAAGDTAAIAKYTRWMNADHRFYVKWYDQGTTEADNPTKATVYDVRIIGLNHDDKSDGSGKAGITFQFVDCLNEKYRSNATATKTGGWGGSEIRARMNSGTSSLSSSIGVDDNAIWNQVPNALKGVLATVSKAYSSSDTGNGNKLISDDALFCISFFELSGGDSLNSSGIKPGNPVTLNAYVHNEGTQYAYWKAQNIRSGYADVSPGLLKGMQKAPSEYVRWIQRTVFPRHPASGNDFYGAAETGQIGGALGGNQLAANAPCFCL